MNIKKMTFEDRFARKYYCNSYRFVPYMKHKNRKQFRRMVQQDTKQEFLRYVNGRLQSLQD